jgi:hypothetical protein
MSSIRPAAISSSFQIAQASLSGKGNAQRQSSNSEGKVANPAELIKDIKSLTSMLDHQPSDWKTFNKLKEKFDEASKDPQFLKDKEVPLQIAENVLFTRLESAQKKWQEEFDTKVREIQYEINPIKNGSNPNDRKDLISKIDAAAEMVNKSPDRDEALAQANYMKVLELRVNLSNKLADPKRSILNNFGF